MPHEPIDKFRKEKLKSIRNSRPRVAEIDAEMKALNAQMQGVLKDLQARLQDAHKRSYYPGKIVAQLTIEIIDLHTKQSTLNKELIDELNIPLEELPFGEH